MYGASAETRVAIEAFVKQVKLERKLEESTELMLNALRRVPDEDRDIYALVTEYILAELDETGRVAYPPSELIARELDALAP